jgi:DNA-binding transcriptional MerR regulator
VRAVARTGDHGHLTIDELAASTGTTTRRLRSFQSLGLVPGPALRGRTGLYGPGHHERVAAILRLQEQGFSLESIGVLFRALEAGSSLAEVVGVPAPLTRGRAARGHDAGTPPGRDDAELYGFGDLQRGAAGGARATGGGRPLLSVVPTTVWDESEAS